MAAAQAQVRRNSTKEAEAARKEVESRRHDDGVLLLHTKLEKKTEVQAAERARMAAETKKIRFEQMQQAAGASAVSWEGVGTCSLQCREAHVPGGASAAAGC